MQAKVDNLNLDNFNQSSNKYPILNSPRSLEACRRQGINQEDLIIKTLEDMKVIYPDKIKDKKHLEVKLNFYEEKRKIKLQLAKEERALIKEQERQGLIAFDEHGQPKYSSASGSSFHGSKQGNSSLIEREKKQLEKIRFRQQKEIEQMMEYEIKMQEIRVQNEEKMQIDREREMQRQKELQDKRKKQEEIRAQMELERKQKAELEIEKIRKKEIEMEEQEQQRHLQEEQKKREHQLNLLKKEEERKIKQEQFKQSVEQKFKSQQDLILSKKMEMDQKNEFRRKVLEEKNRIRALQAEEKRILQEKKLTAAKEKSDLELLKIKEEFLKKEHLNEEKRQQFEEERRKKVEENKMMAQKHQEQITEVLEKMRRMEEEKKMQYLHKIEEAEERKKQLDLLQEEENKRKAQQEIENQQKRNQVKELNETMLKEKTQNYLDKLNQKEQNVVRIQDRREQELLDKINSDNIKRFDRRDTVGRIQRQQGYQRTLLMDKIQDKMQRATSIQDERQQLLLQRQWMRQEIEKQKKGIIVKMEKVKLGKLNPQDVMNEFKSSTTTGSLFLPSDNMSKTFPNKSTQSPEAKKRKLIDTVKEKKQFTSTIKPAVVPNDASEKEINKIILEMKQKQNVEMLRLLEEEQNNEYKREKQLNEIQDPKERQKAEKLMQADRAKGQARIQKLTDQHFDEIIRIRRQYAGITQ